jgi:hypothetical protein
MSFIGTTASTNVDNPAIERPIYIENLVRTREHSYRAEAANGISRIPINAVEECWDKFSDIPLEPPPELITNGGPYGVIERVAIGLYPISKHKGVFGGWAYPSPPPEFQASVPISRVIPANFGNGGYQPTLILPGVGPTPYDGHSWLIDGLNHYIEFPYGIPENISGPPVLTFYRYNGPTGGGGEVLSGPPGDPGPTGPTGATGPVGPTSSGAEGLTGAEGPMGGIGFSSLLNKAGVAVGTFQAPIDILATTIIDNTQTNTYYPSTRLVPMSVIAPLLSTLEFDVAGIMESEVSGEDYETVAQFGIWVGDVDENTTTTKNVLGIVRCPLADVSFTGNLCWSYKMVATHVSGNVFDSLAFRWSGQARLSNGTGTVMTFGFNSGFFQYENVSELLTAHDDKIPFTLYVNNEFLSGPGQLTVTKFNHIFRLVA